MPKVVLISTAEFTLKSHPVRQQLSRLLKRHIRFKIKRLGHEKSDVGLAGGFIVAGNFEDNEDVARSLAKTFGVANVDACEQVRSTLEEIVDLTAGLAEKKLTPGETFAVRARSYEPSQIKSKDIEVQAGAEILSRFSKRVKVNLTSPDRTFRVFYGAKETFVSCERFRGPGGLPVGSQGSLIGIASDAAYSPLAFYQLMKRGAVVSPVVPTPPMGGVPSTEILKGLKTLAGYVPKKTYWARLVDADDQTRKALNSVDDSVRGIFIARLMVRVALYLTRGVLGVVTADMFGHTGLESLSDLRLIDEVARLPVYRPLLMLDDGDASRQLEELGLRSLPAQEISAQAGVIRSQASIASLRELEERVNVEQLARALAASSTKIAV